MDSYPVVWGIDIGHAGVKAVKLQRTLEGGVTVLGYAMEPINVAEGGDRDAAVLTAVRHLAEHERITDAPVFAALSGKQIFTRTINVPVINAKKVGRMVELEARQQIPGDFNDVRWGYHLSPAADGVSNDVTLFAARKELVDGLIQLCKACGLQLAGISITSLAVYNFVRFDQEFADDEAVVVLDVGAQNTDLVVYQGDMLWMRTLGISGGDITRAFMKKFRVSFEEAEQLKCQVQDSRQADRIIKVIEGSLSELIADVQRSLGFYKNTSKDARFESVVVSGNTFKLPGLSQYLADRLGMAIIELVELERIKVASGLDRGHFLDDLQSLGVAMGLGLQGLGMSRANVNLLPSSEMMQAVLKRKRWAAVAILAVILVSWLTVLGVRKMRVEASVAMYVDVTRAVERNRNDQREAEQLAQQVVGLAPQISAYADHGAHVGVLFAVESGVLAAVETIARNQDFLGDGIPRDPVAGGDPVPQPIYLESIAIPELPLGAVSVFRPTAVAREVRVVVRVPADAHFRQIMDAFDGSLRAIPLSGPAWQALNPGAAEPAEPPPLFSEVRQLSQPTRNDTFIYLDPYYRDPVTDIIQEVQRTIQRRVYVVTYVCVLGGGEDAAAAGLPPLGSGGDDFDEGMFQ